MSIQKQPSHNHGEFASPEPYPEVKVLAPNHQYALLLQDDYAGIVSEFTAISQYLYHHFFFENINKELGELLSGIAIVEMHHMELLGETIILLGGNPQIRGSYSTRGAFWNGSFVYYGNNTCQQLATDIQSEKDAIQIYREHICLIADPYIKQLLARIILDEQVHIKHFQKAMERFGCC